MPNGEAPMLQRPSGRSMDSAPACRARAVVEFGFHQQFSCEICRNEERWEVRRLKYCSEYGAPFEGDRVEDARTNRRRGRSDGN